MRVRDRMALAWRGYWAEQRHEFRQMALLTREDWWDFLAEWRQRKHLQQVIRRKITGLENPTRRDVRRVEREWKRSQR